jgi:hypothetical protein
MSMILSNGYYSISGVDFADEKKFRLASITPETFGGDFRVLYVMLDENGFDTNVTVTVYGKSDEIWKKDGVIHRDGQPAFYQELGFESRNHTKRNQDAEYFLISVRKWYQDGILHRLDGPALESNLSDDQWWFEGVRVA